VTILLNGERRDLHAPLTVLALLEQLSIDPRVVAVEHNRVIVKRARYGDEMIDEGSEVEIVAFVGGGASTTTVRITAVSN
jgi:thiamine biosynthesis protein ThiS